ncbi:MAG: LacI family DNA-binding transcriptional regulator [Candidatus Omnitrophota bacterium]
MSKENINIDDVAKLAGVSITTVSRVINKFPTVKEENRKKVESAIRRLKYKPNLSAQRLASGCNDTIGLEMPRYEGLFYSFYAMEIFRSVGIACDALKADLLLHLTDGTTFINSAAVGGVVFADLINNKTHVETLMGLGVPIVLMNYTALDLDVTSVGIDNLRGAQTAIEYLVNHKHRKIAFLTGDLATQAAQQRLSGYKIGLEKAKIELNDSYVFRCDYSRKSARSAAEKILAMKEKPTAVFASSDDMAMEVIAVFMENGLKCPNDISVMGFDDDPVCLIGPIALTTVKQPLSEMAQAAVKELYLQMKDQNRQIKRLILPTELIVRDSVKPLRGV